MALFLNAVSAARAGYYNLTASLARDDIGNIDTQDLRDIVQHGRKIPSARS